MLLEIFSWLEQHLLPCAYKQLFGWSCPMCGAQRAIVCLLRGDVGESVRMFPPLFPLFVTALLVLVGLKRRMIFKALFLKFVFVVDGALLLLNMVLKNCN